MRSWTGRLGSVAGREAEGDPRRWPGTPPHGLVARAW
jgi:hypothetical protein